MNLANEINKLKCGTVKSDEDLAKYTTYKIAGRIEVVVWPQTVKQLIKLKKYLIDNKIKHIVLGKGSNVIFARTYYDGVLISLEKFDSLKIIDDVVVVGSGYSIVNLAYLAARNGLSGLEFAAGIPGSVGGSIYMNAGAYASDMSMIVKKIKVLTPDLKIKTFFPKDIKFGYRSSFLQSNKDYICLEVVMKLKKRDAKSILMLIEDRRERRLASQPIQYPSAGSVFRNPENDFAGRLIEELGFKGCCVGGAMVSEKHANFIINVDGAIGEDVVKLINKIKQAVFLKYKIDLKVEQEIIE